MTPTEVSAATASAVGAIGAHFMLDAATYATGTDLGFNGIDFYLAGRAGVLGAVDSDVVSAALVFFSPAGIRNAWDAGAVVMPRHEAASAFIDCGHRWARAHLGDGVDWPRLAELAAKVADAASPAGAPLFAGWRVTDRPAADDAKALALHNMNLLRELRMATHGTAVLAAGIDPLEAVMVRTPYMAEIFGWTEPFPDPEPSRAAWTEAEATTTERFGSYLAALDSDEQAEFIQLCEAASDAVT